MSREKTIMTIVLLLIEWLEVGDFLKELLKQIQAGEDISDEELIEGLEDVKNAVKRAKEARLKLKEK